MNKAIKIALIGLLAVPGPMVCKGPMAIFGVSFLGFLGSIWVNNGVNGIQKSYRDRLNAIGLLAFSCGLVTTKFFNLANGESQASYETRKKNLSDDQILEDKEAEEMIRTLFLVSGVICCLGLTSTRPIFSNS